jgi:hypothetical protein
MDYSQLTGNGFVSVFEVVNKGQIGETVYILWVNLVTGKSALTAKISNSNGYEIYSLSPIGIKTLLENK